MHQHGSNSSLGVERCKATSRNSEPVELFHSFRSASNRADRQQLLGISREQKQVDPMSERRLLSVLVVRKCSVGLDEP